MKAPGNIRSGAGRDTPAVLAAREILRGRSADARAVLALCEGLRSERQFGFARRLLATVRYKSIEDADLRLDLAHQAALCTYKDPDLPADARLDSALEILETRCNLKSTRVQETLGLAGAIFKRRWEVDAQKENLERSLAYYLRGYELGPENDYGYTGINAAFVLDLLAEVEIAEANSAGASSDIAATRGDESRAIREDLVDVLPDLPDEAGKEWLASSWWFLVTVGEAFFGLRRYDEASKYLGRAASLDVESWKYESTAKQLGALARLHAGVASTAAEFEKSAPGHVLQRFLGEHAIAVRSAFTGKLGLALSGGGFRASLFHIGVLARLAEADILRHVEVLSCVSGGSIVGAHFYLLLRNLLQQKKDADISRDDYVELVRRLQKDFLAGVQTNVRARVMAEFLTNLKLIFLPGYSRTMRAGELYERLIYAKVADDRLAGASGGPRWLDELFVCPPGEDPASFRPRDKNWCRRAKVPELILNATTLNTGHNWQFTASWMGEPPASINTRVDGNYRLRRMYHWEAPAPHNRIRLGHAVAASGCVPGLFEPLTLNGLYPDITVALVDGGIHDNQGVVGLLEQDCQVLLVSDASGQTEAEDAPSRSLLGVPLRSNGILMARVREERFENLQARRRSGLLRGLMTLHLKKNLPVSPKDWHGCEDPRERMSSPASESKPTPYGVPCDVQRRLAALRTDLDSFTDAEAFALMSSGYRMSAHALETDPALMNLACKVPATEPWPFLKIESLYRDPVRKRMLLRLLDVGRYRSFKPWRLLTPLRWIALVLGVLALVYGLTLVARYGSMPLLTVKSLAIAAGIALAGAIFGKTAEYVLGLQSTASKALTGLALAIAGPIIVRAHLHVFDRLYLKAGRLDSLKP